MTFFKVIQDKQIIDAGFTFLSWNQKYAAFYVAEDRNGQFVQSFRGDRVYRDEWMWPIQNGTEIQEYTNAYVEVIDEQEYEDIVTMLTEGEEISVQEETVPTEPEPEITEEKETEEKPLSISEMRKIIAEQSSQIEQLMKIVLNE